MKRIILASLISIFSVGAFASDWAFYGKVDDFTDHKSCAVHNIKGFKKASITFYVTPNPDKPGVYPASITLIRGKISGLGVKYRVDKKEVVELGYKNEYETDEDVYIFRNEEYEKIIKDFSNGESLVLSVVSSNRFIDDERIKISLKGFKEAYQEALECK